MFVFVYVTEYYSAIKKNEIVPFETTWADLMGIMLSEISQTEKDKHHVIPLRWESKKGINKKQNRTSKYREQTAGLPKGKGMGDGQTG